MPRLHRLARYLGLELVGCVLGAETAMWSAGHVYAALQLRNFTSNPSEFVVIRCVVSVLSIRTLDWFFFMYSVSLNKIEPKKRTAVASQDLSIEAFQLSKQAVELHRRGLLGVAYPSSKAYKRRCDKVELLGDVLVQSEEVGEIDPLLFAVPVPVAKAGEDASSSKRRTARTEAIEHAFLTQTQLLGVGDETKVHAAHVCMGHFLRMRLRCFHCRSGSTCGECCTSWALKVGPSSS